MRRIELLVVHCAYSTPEMDIGVAEIDRWHKERGWDGCGYHYVLRRNGILETARPLDQAGVHAAGFNARSVGICLAGGKRRGLDQPETNFTPAQYAALRALLEELLQRFPGAQVLGHRDLPGVAKACPCFEVRPWFYSGQAPVAWLGAPEPRLEEDFWRGIEHFRPSEFDRPMDPGFIRRLDQARNAAGLPFRVERTISDRAALVRIQEAS